MPPLLPLCVALLTASDPDASGEACLRPDDATAAEDAQDAPSAASPEEDSRPPRLRALQAPELSLVFSRIRATPSLGVRAELEALPARLVGMGLRIPVPPSVLRPPGAGTPRMHTEMGFCGRAPLLGVFELYAHGGAVVGADATPRHEEDRDLSLLPMSRVGVGARPSQHVELAIELSRRGPVSFDPWGDEARGMASLRWHFGR